MRLRSSMVLGYTMQNSSYQREQIITAIENLEDLPTLPRVAQRVVALSQDPKTSYRDLKTVILPDPPLAAKVMMMANSAFFHRHNQAKIVENHHTPDNSQKYPAQTAVVRISSILVQHRFYFCLPFDKLPDYFPHHLADPSSPDAVIEMKERYEPYVNQADTIADLMTGWL